MQYHNRDMPTALHVREAKDVGVIIDSPQPLRNCPTLSVWRKRSGEIYLFFVDETYLQFSS